MVFRTRRGYIYALARQLGRWSLTTTARPQLTLRPRQAHWVMCTAHNAQRPVVLATVLAQDAALQRMSEEESRREEVRSWQSAYRSITL